MGCLDPLIVDDADQPPPEKEWFCPSCIAERVSTMYEDGVSPRDANITGKATVPPLPPDPGPFDYLIRSIESAIPKTFSLPDNVRGYFKTLTVLILPWCRCHPP